MTLRWCASPARILDFDCEARPLSWIGGDFVSKEITVIGAKWIGEPGGMNVWCLGDVDMVEMLEGFRSFYDQADMVVGHNLLRYDLSCLNAMRVEARLPSLKPKLVQDTYLHLVKRQGISASQKNLAEMLGVPAPKVEMSDPKWRDANRLKPEGIRKAYERVAGDVLQNIALRERLLELGYLKSPRMWSP